MEYGSLLNPPDPPERYYPDDYDPSLNGVGGWLGLVIIGRFLTLISGFKDLVDLTKLLGKEPSLDGVIYLSIFFDAIVYVLLSATVLYFMFARKIVFRILLVAQLAGVFLFTIIFNIVLSGRGYDTSYANLVSLIVGSAIWIPYLYKSRRVKNTYIYPYQDFGEGPVQGQ